MCQRIMIAMAIACDPKLLIADEPTTALDVTIQKQILQLLSGLRERRRTSVLLITHDLGVVAENADRVLVMYAGKVIEQATVQQLFEAPAHPYTQGLIDSTPNLDLQGGLLASIPGHVPDLARLPAGCAFAPRCSHAQSRCHVQMPDLSGHVDQRQVRCWFPLTLPVKA
jgi:oligopeptide/dipeptide ABC transporter ATP-binding protein